MNSDDQLKKEEIYKYWQKQFLASAQRRIDQTLERLNKNSSNSFQAMQREAFDKTMGLMRQMGIYDLKKRLLKGTQEEADAIFDVYYNAYLDREKDGQPRKGRNKHILEGKALNRFGKSNFL